MRPGKAAPALPAACDRRAFGTVPCGDHSTLSCIARAACATGSVRIIEVALSPHTFTPLNAEMLERIREKDWSTTPLGARETWSDGLRVAVDMILASPNGMILLWGPELIQIYNDAYRTVMGHRHPAGLGQGNRECWPEVWHFNAPIYERVRQGETVIFTEQHLILERHGAPEDAWFDLCFTPLVTAEGVTAGILVSVSERTDRMLAEQALRTSERRLAAAIEASEAGVFEYQVPLGAELHLSPRWCGILGYERLPVPPDEFEAWYDEQIHPEDRQDRHQAFAAFLAGGAPRHDAEFRLRHAGGSWIWVREFADAVDHDETGAVTRLSGMILDVTQRKHAEREAQRLANYDPLTGLANRGLFAKRLAEAIALARDGESCVGLVLIDLDRFKVINDTLGHPAGDALLQVVARRLSAGVRSGDTVARLGGDEFALILRDASSRSAVEALARRVCRSMVQPALIEGQMLEPAGSFGVATHPPDGDSAKLLMRHADLALYNAKQSKSENVRMFHRGLARDALERTNLEADLRRAISQDAIAVHYQPQVELSSGRIRGVEALARWPRGREGRVAPTRLIELAEASSLIRPLGAAVLAKACAQAAAWQAAGHPLTMAVNLSPAEVTKDGFSDSLAPTLEAAGIEGAMLELEITERLIVDPDETAIREFFRTCERLGIRLAIDDFGVGYSSLSYLSRLPIAKIKIDRSFVAGIGRREDEMLIEGIVNLGHRLGMRVTAEGIETERQLRFLTEAGCDEAQGYLLQRPAAGEVISALLQAGGSAAAVRVPAG